MRVSIRATVIMVAAAAVAACGGGGGGGTGGGGGNPPAADTFTVSLTAIEMTDTRTGADVTASGLPIRGATITVD